MLRAASVLVLAGALVGLVGVAPATAGGGSFEGSDSTETSGDAGGGSISVTISASGTTSGGHTFHTSVPGGSVSVPPLCWLEANDTGAEFWEIWKPGGPGYQAGTTEAYAAQGLLPKNFEDHKDDTEGHWYGPMCDLDADPDFILAYQLAHLPDIYVEAGDQPPADTVVVDPAVLADAAYKSLRELLPPGKLDWNPRVKGFGGTIVGKQTGVWLEDASRHVEVTASIPGGTWARVDADLAKVAVDADGATPQTCDGDVRYPAGATETSCLTFDRSTAHLAGSSGSDVPTTMLTATSTWEASWVSSEDANPTALDAQTVTTDAQIAVAEIESIVNP